MQGAAHARVEVGGRVSGGHAAAVPGSSDHVCMESGVSVYAGYPRRRLSQGRGLVVGANAAGAATGTAAIATRDGIGWGANAVGGAAGAAAKATKDGVVGGANAVGAAAGYAGNATRDGIVGGANAVGTATIDGVVGGANAVGEAANAVGGAAGAAGAATRDGLFGGANKLQQLGNSTEANLKEAAANTGKRGHSNPSPSPSPSSSPSPSPSPSPNLLQGQSSTRLGRCSTMPSPRRACRRTGSSTRSAPSSGRRAAGDGPAPRALTPALNGPLTPALSLALALALAPT